MQDALLLLAPNVGAQDFTDKFAPLDADAATQLGNAFLKDAIATAGTLQVDTWCSIGEGAEGVARLLPTEVRAFPQRGDDYATRLRYASEYLLGRSYKRVIIVPMDCPVIDPKYILLGFEALAGADAVVGPSSSGGYVLIGLSNPIPRLFVEIDMTRNDVLRQTLLRAKELDLFMNVVPPRRGIDSFQDLKNAAEAGELGHALNTLAVLAAQRV
jgi:uncharacterized protein